MGEDRWSIREVWWGTLQSSGEQGMHQGAGKVYRIIVRSELSRRYAAAFEGMDVETTSGMTILTGEVIDQPHLYGVIDRINGLGLELVSVQPLDEVH